MFMDSIFPGATRRNSLTSPNFTWPNQTAKKINTDLNLRTITAKLSAGLNPTGEVTFATNSGHNTAVEEQNDRVTPKWVVDSHAGHDFKEGKDYYEELKFSYMSTSDSRREQYPLKVEFSMGINVDDLEKPANTNLPPTAFIIRDQTMLWLSNRSLKSKGSGIIVLTSAYIAEIQAVDQLSIVEYPTLQLNSDSTLKVPVTDQTSAMSPENRISVSIGMLPDKVEPGLFKRLSSLVTKPLSNYKKPAPSSEIQSLPLFEFASRGWDATRHEWRMPIYPSLDHCLQQAVQNSTVRTWNLNIVGLDADTTERSKGKQRDPGPVPAHNMDKEISVLAPSHDHKNIPVGGKEQSTLPTLATETATGS
ncbi:hypothetical protein C8R46DRAFT_92470 [Mycena filopes]|nr:hypothetical protein C8R46DRAFT_92470 [Mycena filopes]